MVGVFVAFIRVVYGRMIYMSLPTYRVKRVSQISFKRALLIGQRTTHATAANHSQDFSE